MPYIKDIHREFFKPHCPAADTPGDLNFQITCLLIKYLNHRELSYATINDIRGAIEGAKLEFERRVAFPYEDKKIEENGDVYGL